VPLTKEPGEISEPVSASASKKEETPLTMAMRQAGAEAAKKAGEKKGSMSTARPSTAGLEATEAPMPAIQASMSKAVEEPGVSAETTAAKMPGKLAEEGAKRTSVDKIADEGAKRRSMDKATESDSASEQEHVGLSKEAKTLEARRASSITKTKSPLSEDTSAMCSREHGSPNFEPRPRTHRGSSVSLASREEIQEIEQRNAIPEEIEEPDEQSAKPSPQGSEGLEKSSDATMTDVTASDKGEARATKGTKPQDQGAKRAEEAGTSVGD
jgi:hypothetical protein